MRTAALHARLRAQIDALTTSDARDAALLTALENDPRAVDAAVRAAVLAVEVEHAAALRAGVPPEAHRESISTTYMADTMAMAGDAGGQHRGSVRDRMAALEAPRAASSQDQVVELNGARIQV